MCSSRSSKRVGRSINRFDEDRRVSDSLEDQPDYAVTPDVLFFSATVPEYVLCYLALATNC